MNEWTLVASVVASPYRSNVLHALVAGPLTPSIIASKTKIRQGHVSRSLSQLKKIGLVVCLTPEAKRGRLYKITDLGKEILLLLPV